MKFQTVLGAAALCVALAVPASAQQNQMNVVKKVDDWMVRCANIESPSPCDMLQLLVNNNTKQRVLSISIAYVPSASRHTMQLGVPLGITLGKGVLLTAGSFKSKKLNYRRCNPEGCYVELVVDEEIIQALSAGSSATAIVTDGNGKEVPIAFSLKGFSSARDQMAELARQKAKTPAAAPAAPAAPEAPANP